MSSIIIKVRWFLNFTTHWNELEVLLKTDCWPHYQSFRLNRSGLGAENFYL